MVRSPEAASSVRVLEATLLVHVGTLAVPSHSTVHKEKFKKMQQCIKILLFIIYMKLNMFRTTHRPSSGA